MTAWKAKDKEIPKEDAKDAILTLAEEQGLKGTFKVYYDGTLIADPDDLPETVDMSKVKVAAVLDQA